MQVFSALAISFMLFAISFLDQSARTTSTASVLLSGEETAALRELRTSLVRSHLKPPSSWVVEESDCCSWEGVECRSSNEISTAAATTHSSSASTSITNNTSSRMVVEGLLLSNVSGHNYEKPWYTLNLGVFKAFQQLRQLDLSLNNINGSLESLEISGMRKLQHLNLSHNDISGTIPKTWAALSSLIYLDLSDNNLRGPLDGEVISGMRKLQHLNLRYNYFSGTIPKTWAALSSLIYLDLSDNNLRGPLDGEAFSSLKYLDLSGNKLNGTLSSQGFIVSLRNLEHLDLCFNKDLFNGSTIPTSWVAALSSLKFLGLSYTGLSGPFPTVLTSFKGLIHLDLARNTLIGPLPTNVLTSFKGLIHLALAGNSLTGPLPTDDTDTAGSLNKLEYLDLSQNGFEGGIPESWVSLASLKRLDLNSNRLNGSLPNQVLTSFSELQYLYLQNNSFTGPLPLQDTIAGLNKLEVLDLGSNGFEGGIPESWANLTSLSYLDLSHNRLNSSFPNQVFTSFSELRYLYLQNISFTGPLPLQDTAAGLNKLERLDLSSNGFEGGIPESWADLTSLTYLDVSNNRLNGSFPNQVFTSFSELRYLLLGNNFFTGPLPLQDTAVGHSKLVYLDLSNNGFEGGIPESWVTLTSLRFLLLGHNKLNGSLQSRVFTSFSELRYLYLRNNSFTGPLPLQDTAVGLKKLEVLDLGSNGFEGGIPESWADLTSLSYLDLSHNRLNGSFPNQVLTSLLELRYLDLKNNSLTGPLPLQDITANLHKLWHLDLSYNRFEGEMHEF